MLHVGPAKSVAEPPGQPPPALGLPNAVEPAFPVVDDSQSVGGESQRTAKEESSLHGPQIMVLNAEGEVTMPGIKAPFEERVEASLRKLDRKLDDMTSTLTELTRVRRLSVSSSDKNRLTTSAGSSEGVKMWRAGLIKRGRERGGPTDPWTRAAMRLQSPGLDRQGSLNSQATPIDRQGSLNSQNTLNSGDRDTVARTSSGEKVGGVQAAMASRRQSIVSWFGKTTGKAGGNGRPASASGHGQPDQAPVAKVGSGRSGKLTKARSWDTLGDDVKAKFAQGKPRSQDSVGSASGEPERMKDSSESPIRRPKDKSPNNDKSPTASPKRSAKVTMPKVSTNDSLGEVRAARTVSSGHGRPQEQTASGQQEADVAARSGFALRKGFSKESMGDDAGRTSAPTAAPIISKRSSGGSGFDIAPANSRLSDASASNTRGRLSDASPSKARRKNNNRNNSNNRRASAMSQQGSAPSPAHSLMLTEDTMRKMTSLISVANSATDKSEYRNNRNSELEKKLRFRMTSMKSTEHHGKTNLALFIKHPLFDTCIMILVLLNALLIGAQTQLQALHGSSVSNRGWFLAAEYTCTMIFAIELVMRICVHRRRFFHDFHEKHWNMFDTFLVIVSVLDFLLASIVGEDDGGPVLKVLRVLRVSRVMRILRTVRFVSELRVMVQMIVTSLLSLSWIMVILLAVIYVFSIVLTTGATEYLSEHEGLDLRPQEYRGVKDAFGSLFETMYTLYKAMAGGRDWGEVSSLLRETGWVYEAILICYTFFTIFAVVNIVTGVFVDGAIELAKRDRTILMQKQARESVAQEGHLLGLLQAIDVDGDDMITADEFKDALQRPEVREYISAMRVEFSDAHAFFDLLDQDGNGTVDIVEFVTGMQRLRGEAKSVDIHMMVHENRKMVQMVTGLIDFLGTTWGGVLQPSKQLHDGVRARHSEGALAEEEEEDQQAKAATSADEADADADAAQKRLRRGWSGATGTSVSDASSRRSSLSSAKDEDAAAKATAAQTSSTSAPPEGA